MGPAAFPDPPTKTLRVTSFIYSMILLQNWATNTLQAHQSPSQASITLHSHTTAGQNLKNRLDGAKKKTQISSASVSAGDSLQLVQTHPVCVHSLNLSHVTVFFACECEWSHVKLDPDAWGVVFQPGGLCTDSRANMHSWGRKCRERSEKGDAAFKKIYLYYLTCMCCRGQRLTRQSQSGLCREVRHHLFFEWFWLGSAAGWCNSRKYRPSAVLAAVSVRDWQTTVNAKRKKKMASAQIRGLLSYSSGLYKQPTGLQSSALLTITTFDPHFKASKES